MNKLKVLYFVTAATLILLPTSLMFLAAASHPKEEKEVLLWSGLGIITGIITFLTASYFFQV